MRIAIVETGAPPGPLSRAHGDYPAMMRRMLAPFSPGLDFATIRLASGEILPRAADFGGLLITGSSAGVYENHAWIEPLKDLVRATAAANRPQVGICFGHQLMAEAFGGRVERSDKGWGVGVHAYEVRATAGWMRSAPARIACAASHRDQIVAPPAGARILLASDFCPYAALAYLEGPAISFQMHPEFTHDYARALLDLRKEGLPADLYASARNTLRRESDRDTIAGWIADFFMEAAL